MGTNVGETAEGVATFMTHLLGVFLLGPDGLGAGSEISGGRGEHQDIPGLLIHSPKYRRVEISKKTRYPDVEGWC
jgi:hypothetical protein